MRVSSRRVLGGVMMAAPFVAFMALVVAAHGWLGLVPVAVAVALAGWLVIAINLMDE